MNKYLKNLNRIEFVVTSACTGRCKHCSQGEHNSNDNLDKDIAADAVRKIAEKYNIDSVMTFGGEPLLCPETVFAVHKAATEMDIPRRQLITNGYFSTNEAKIRDVAVQLAQCGVNDILLSVDAFHQETIPLTYVKAFAENVKNTGGRIRVHPAWLVSLDDNNEYNTKTRELIREFTELGLETSEGNVIFPSGNALKYFGEYFDLSKPMENPYTEDPTDVKAICLSANGDILGRNIYSDDICKILSEYNPSEL